MKVLDLVILKLIHEGNGQWGWYQLETRLSRMEVPRSPDLMTVLKSLSSQGLIVQRLTEGSPNDRWEITEKGLKQISNDD